MGYRFLIILVFTSFTLFSQTVKVGIVGYTLLDEFRIQNNNQCVIIVDGKKYYGENLLIDQSGEIIGDSFNSIFNRVQIINPGIITFISNKGLQTYRGDFEITYDNGLEIINIVNENYYLASVLGSEMGLNFHPEALKAQLLAIKLFYNIRKERNIKKDWDILNTSRVMAYRGEEYMSKTLLEIVESLEHINLILPGNIEPMFFSTASGYILKQECLTSTINNRPKNPLLLTDDNIDSPYYNFKVDILEKDLLELLGIYNGNITGVELIKFNSTDCNDFIGFKNQDGEITWLKAYTFVSKMQRLYGSAFKSIQFDVKQDRDKFTFTGSGFGHFIGMSQYGAQDMALNNMNFKDILLYYYPGGIVE